MELDPFILTSVDDLMRKSFRSGASERVAEEPRSVRLAVRIALFLQAIADSDKPLENMSVEEALRYVKDPARFQDAFDEMIETMRSSESL